MSKPKLLCIAPYGELGERCRLAAQSFPDISVDVLVGNLEDAVMLTRSIQLSDYDILLSRGGTADLLRKLVDKPVLSIGISVYDMLRLIRIAQQTSCSFAIVGYASIITTSRILCEILQYDIPLYEIQGGSDIRSVLLELMGRGMDLFIGDTITVRTATQIGANSLLITSGQESIEQALMDARRLWQNTGLLNQTHNVFKSAVSRLDSLFTILDSQGNLLYFNRIPDFMPLSAYLEMLKALTEELSGKEQIQTVRQAGSHQLRIRGLHIREHGKSFFVFSSAASVVTESGKPGAMTVYSSDELSELPNMRLFSSETLRRLDEGFPLSRPGGLLSVLCGKPGTGKTLLAKYIHINYLSSSAPFILIDCSLLDQTQWRQVSHSLSDPFYGEGVSLYFRNFHRLEPEVRQSMQRYFQSAIPLKRFHVTVSAHADGAALSEYIQLASSIFPNPTVFSLSLPSLRERRDDIPQFASLFISRYNHLYSKQVIGFLPEALSILCTHSWEQNLSELELAVRQLVSGSTGSYIYPDEVRQVLHQSDSPGSSKAVIHLDQTLDQIEQEIVHRILVEENYNQTAAAKRLGIARSTLWRKLSDHAEKIV